MVSPFQLELVEGVRLQPGEVLLLGLVFYEPVLLRGQNDVLFVLLAAQLQLLSLFQQFLVY